MGLSICHLLLNHLTMKIVFLAVSLIAAFMVDCRSHPGPDSQPSIIAEQTPQWTDLTLETGDSEETSSTIAVAPEEPGFTFGPEFDIEEEEELNERKLRGSGCKPKPECISMGGHCVNSTTSCPGRLAPELCKGNCGCCIPECPTQPSNSSSTTFIAPGTQQCMRIFTDRSRNWTDSKALCEEHGMELARPYNAVALRSYLIQHFGHYMGQSWLNARGTGSYFRWQDDQDYILNYDPLWYRGRYSSANRSSSYCLMLAAHPYYWNISTTQPYMAYPCRNGRRALCELKLKM